MDVCAVLIEGAEGEVLGVEWLREVAESVERVAHLTESAEEEDDEGVDVVGLDDEGDEGGELGGHGLVAHTPQDLVPDGEDECLLREQDGHQLAHLVGLLVAYNPATLQELLIRKRAMEVRVLVVDLDLLDQELQVHLQRLRVPLAVSPLPIAEE